MTDTARHEQFLTLIERLLNDDLGAASFCAAFTKLWIQNRDDTYAKKATWLQPYDELLIAAFQRGEMGGDEFREEYARLWGYEEDLEFTDMMNEIHSTCSVFTPAPKLEGEINEEQLRRDVKASLAAYEGLNKSVMQAA